MFKKTAIKLEISRVTNSTERKHVWCCLVVSRIGRNGIWCSPVGNRIKIKGAWSLGGMASGAARLREGSRGRASFGAWS